jgi:hypothetical protein
VGYVLRGGRAAAAEEFHEHQGLVDVAHAHALGDGVAQALVGGGGDWGHGGILALRGPVLGRGVTGGGTCSLSIPLPLAMTIQVCWPLEQLGPCHSAW